MSRIWIPSGGRSNDQPRPSTKPGPRRSMAVYAMLAVLITALIAAVFPAASASASEAGTPSQSNRFVYVVPLNDMVDAGMRQFVTRAFREAEEAGAQYVVLDINTLGGLLEEAINIGVLIQDLKIPTVAFVHGNAMSAGSFIALSADQIVMQPGSTIGAAAIIDQNGNRITDSKTISFWVSKMKGAAEKSGRNPLYAEGMVNDQLVVEVPELGVTFGRGELISFYAEEALKAGYAEHMASNLDGVLDYLGASEYSVVTVEISLAERAGRFLTNPYVQTVLLVIGVAGVVIELLIPGFGLPGILGLAGFALYFLGNFAAGFAGVEHIVMFVAGIVLLLLELFVPSFGILGIIGILSLFSGVVLSANKTGQALLSLGIAILVAIVVVAIVARVFKHRGIWNRFILKDKLDKESGFVSNVERTDLLGAVGKAVTVLRPSGTALINGSKVDVVTNGEFIPAGTAVKVIHVEGLRIVVIEWKEGE